MRDSSEEFIRGLRAGEPRAVQAADRLLGAMAQANHRPSPREIEVLALVAEGLTQREIAAELRVTEETVRTHVRRVRLKLGARNQRHAVALWLRQR